MRLFAHVALDGQISGLVSTHDGVTNAMLVPPPGTQVCEIENHGLKDEAVELDALSKLIEEHIVDLTPAKGQLKRQEK